MRFDELVFHHIRRGRLGLLVSVSRSPPPGLGEALSTGTLSAFVAETWILTPVLIGWKELRWRLNRLNHHSEGMTYRIPAAVKIKRMMAGSHHPVFLRLLSLLMACFPHGNHSGLEDMLSKIIIITAATGNIAIVSQQGRFNGRLLRSPTRFFAELAKTFEPQLESM